MKKRSVLSIILVGVMALTFILGSASSFAATNKSGYVGDYVLKQGSTTIATITVKYEKSALSVSYGGKTWYSLSLKKGSTYTVSKITGITIEFLSGNKMKYTQTGLFSIVLTGTKKPGKTPTPSTTTAVDLTKFVGTYALSNAGKAMGLDLVFKVENGKLLASASNNPSKWYTLQLTTGTTNIFTCADIPGFKLTFNGSKVDYEVGNGMTLQGTKK